MSSATKPVEQKARELLADEFEADGQARIAAAIREGRAVSNSARSLRAIIAALNTDGERIRREGPLREAIGFMMNAKIDLETGATKAAAIHTLDGGIKVARSYLSTPSKGVG